MNETLHSYELALIYLWEKSFGSAHDMLRLAVNKKLKKIVKDYYNKVYNKGKFLYTKLQ